MKVAVYFHDKNLIPQKFECVHASIMNGELLIMNHLDKGINQAISLTKIRWIDFKEISNAKMPSLF